MKRIGLALGAGGARGLAHIVMAEAFEETGIIPSVISGSSIGALVGAAMSAGKSSSEMKSLVKELVLEDKDSFLNIRHTNIKKLFDLMDPTMNTTALMKGEKFHKQFLDFIGVRKFEEFSVPCSIVATNYRDRNVGVFSSGYISAPLKASYSLPGLFPPVKIKDELYYDGRMVNPLPFDIIKDKCDVLIAVDVISETGRIAVNTPTLTELLFSSFQIMNKSIINGMLAKTNPDLLLTIKIPDIRTFEFNRADEIYNLTLPFKEQLIKALTSLK